VFVEQESGFKHSQIAFNELIVEKEIGEVMEKCVSESGITHQLLSNSVERKKTLMISSESSK
jgi:hypothetical protein